MLYVLSALLAGIGGLVYIGLINVAALNLADGLLLPSVAAAVIGGTSIFGGRGGYAGTIVGALILGGPQHDPDSDRRCPKAVGASSSALIVIARHSRVRRASRGERQQG